MNKMNSRINNNTINNASVEVGDKSSNLQIYGLVSRSVRERDTSRWILVGVVLLFSFFLTGWYHNKRNLQGFISLSFVTDKIYSSSSPNSTITSSSQKQVIIVEKRSNTTTIMEETKHNNNLHDSDTVDMDIDLSLSQYECGYYKCFIPSKSNQDIGYLVKVVSKETTITTTKKIKELIDFSQTMPEMIGGWKLAQWIDEQFGDLPNGLHRHFYSDKPFFIQLNETATRKLFELYVLGRRHSNMKGMKIEVGSIFTNQSVIGFPVQKVKRIRIDDFLSYKCYSLQHMNNNKGLRRKNKEYINNVILMGNGLEFYKNLEESYNILQMFFTMKPIILVDFQALFDQKGNMYFLDLDHDFNQTVSKKQNNTCLEGIDRLMNKTKSMIANTITQK